MVRLLIRGLLRSPLAGPLRRLKAVIRPDSFLTARKRVASRYLRGDGIEVGALHNPLPVPKTACVKYVDRMSVANLRRQYPNLANEPLVPVDIVADGETLTGVPDASQDFVIGNHFLEHCEDPIGTLKQFLRVVRPGGVVYIAVPDKRFTFDRERPLTTLNHLIADHRDGPERSRRGHYEEYAEFIHDRHTEHDIAAMANHLIEIGYSIHFHVWTQRELIEMLAWMQHDQPFDVEMILKNEGEVIAVLRKLPT